MTPEPPRTDRAALRVYQGYRYTIVSIANGAQPHTEEAELWWQVAVRWRWVLIGVMVGLSLLLGARFLVANRFDDPQLESHRRADTLVVAMHGLSARPSLSGLKDLVRSTFPDADLIAPSYPNYPPSNVDAYELVDSLEVGIHEA